MHRDSKRTPHAKRTTIARKLERRRKALEAGR